MWFLNILDDATEGVFRLAFRICLWIFIVLPIKIFLWSILGVSYFLMTLSKPMK